MKLSRYILGVCLLVFFVGVGAETIQFHGGTYTGKLVGGIPQGQGTWTTSAGPKYAGEWKDGHRHGQGTYTWADGTKYVGEYKDGKRSGHGIVTWGEGRKYVDGRKYVGEWKDGKQHGQGTWIHPDGTKYVGEWKRGKEHGQGTYTWADGAKYAGEYKDGKRSGHGTYTYANGDKYVGELKYDVHWQGARYNAWGEVIERQVGGMFAPACAGNPLDAWGTGFLVNQNHVVTNAHVVYCCKKVTVLDLSCSDSEEATVVATEQESDLALLRRGRPLQHYATLRSGKELQLGEVVTTKDRRPAVNGCPQYVFGQGKVTKLNWMPNDFRVMKHDSPTSHGSSGGPVLGASGYVVGVTTMAGGAVSAAIKPHLLKAFLKSNNVEYNTTPSTEKLSLSDIKKKSDKFTVIIECVM